MLNEKQIFEIKEHLENAVNPIFFFDNDADGLCSYLILARYLGRGKGVAIKSFPDLNKNYNHKLHELKPDYVFILDKPLVSKEFLDEAESLNIRVVWIDHHDVKIQNNRNIFYYNPAIKKEKSFEPVTYICQQITGRREDLWLAMAGCISDNFLPDFSDEFERQNPELWKTGIKTAFQALYETDVGRIARIFSFAIKDSVSNVVNMTRVLMKAKSPHEILNEEGRIFLRFKYIEKKYRQLIEKASAFSQEKLLYFQYSGGLSLSSDIANELSYKFPEKFIAVAYIKGNKANISLRGKKAREITLKAIDGLENATGGGHEMATGAKVNASDLQEFRRRVESLVG